MATLSPWTRRDPFRDFDDTFSRIVRHAFAPAPVVRPAGFVPAADLARDGEDAVLRLELPGLDVERDVAVEVDRGRLTISGERRSQHEEDGNGRQVREVRYGSFRRSFALPEQVGAEAVSAGYDAGVLTVRVAGAYAPTQPTAQRIAIAATPAAPAVDGGDAETGAPHAPAEPAS